MAKVIGGMVRKKSVPKPMPPTRKVGTISQAFKLIRLSVKRPVMRRPR